VRSTSVAKKWEGGTCSHNNGVNNPSWWYVVLPEEKIIFGVSILTRDGYDSRTVNY